MCYTENIESWNNMRLDNVVKCFEKQEEKITVLNHINYNFESGKLYAITGHSGSGKTTLINLLGLIEQPTSGKVFIDNKDVSKLNDFETSKIRSEKIGFVFQNYYLDENLKAYENVMVPMIINKNIKKEERKTGNTIIREIRIKGKDKSFPKRIIRWRMSKSSNSKSYGK